MIPFKADEIKFQLPSGWHEVSVGKYVEILKASHDFVDVLSVMSGLDKDIWLQSKQNDVDIKIFPLIKWAWNTDELKKLPLPKEIKIKGVVCKVPKDLGFKSFGQKVLLSNEIKEGLEKPFHIDSCMSYALAVYFYNDITGLKYDDEKAREFAKEIEKDILITDAYPIADFFLQKSIEYLHSTMIVLSQQLPTKSSAQELKSLKSTES